MSGVLFQKYISVQFFDGFNGSFMVGKFILFLEKLFYIK